jgi:acyl-CoA thioesterase FadM/predicted enzyme related to lactoylglutathione lyase
MRIFHYETTISAEQVDLFGHVNNAAYLSIFEAARWSTLTEAGSTWSDLAAIGVGPVVLDVALHFIQEVREGETVRVETHFLPTSPRRFVAHHRMLGADARLRAAAEIQAGFFDMTTRRLVTPPTALLSVLGFEGETLPPHPIVQGVGGVFLDAHDVIALAAWYGLHLGLTLQNWGSTRGVEFPSADLVPSRRAATTTFALFPATSPLGESRTGRVNLRVGDLEALVQRLEAAGVKVERQPGEDYGRFAWAWDPEGNRIELWEPLRNE